MKKIIKKEKNNPLAGTLRLIRLALRRDRVKLTIWLVAIIGILGLTVPAVTDSYKTPEDRAVYYNSVGTSTVARMFNGIVDSPDISSIVMVESYVFTAILIAFMNTLLIIRHTRSNEESGSAELISSAVVGRFSMLTSSLIIATVLNGIVFIASGLILSSAPEVSSSGAWWLATVFGLVGMTFASVSALFTQLTQSARGANSLAGLFIALSFLARAVGDGFSVSGVNGQLSSSWPSWLSIFGWGQQVHPMGAQDIFPLILFFIATIGCLVGAYTLLAKRDFGSGVFEEKKGPRHAPKSLLSNLGLTWRLHRATIITWIIVAVLLGLLYGSMAEQFKDLLSANEEAQKYISSLGGEGSVVDTFIRAMMSFTSIAFVAYLAQSFGKMNAEESSYRLEMFLSTKVSRRRWLAGHVGVVLAGLATMVVAIGLATGFGIALFTSQKDLQLWHYLSIVLGQLPALLIFGGFFTLLLGSLPKFSLSIYWATFTLSLLISQLGALLKLPNWVINLSPFSHIPMAGSPSWSLILNLSGIALALVILGFVTFQRRDI